LQPFKSKFLIIILSTLVALEGFSLVGLQSKYDELNRRSSVFETLYTELNVSYNYLNTSYQTLAIEYTDLRSAYENLTQTHMSLRFQYEQTAGSYEDLQDTYSELRREHQIEETLRIGNSLESYYDLVRDEEGFMGKWYGDQRDIDFCAKLALHDLGRNCWPSLENKYYEDVGNYSYVMAKNKINDVIGLIEVHAYDSPAEKIEKILQFLSDHLHYELEVNNVYLAPTETLGFKSGDCDDFTTLGAALFEAAGIDAAVGFFKNEKDKYHCMVLVHLKDLEGYDFWKFDDLTGKGLEEGRWIIIEPQYTIENQGDDWIHQWQLLYTTAIE